MKRRAYRFVMLFLILTMLLSACGGGKATQTAAPKGGTAATPTTAPASIEVEGVTLAHGLTEKMAPIDPGNEFGPNDTVYLSVKLKGNPKSGVVSADFKYGKQEIAAAKVDLAQERKKQGVIFSIGGNTFVGFTLTHEKPFPPGETYRVDVEANGVPVGSYTFKVTGEAAASAPTTTPGVTPKPTSGGAPAAGHEVTINALYYATDPKSGKAIGGVSPVRIAVRPAEKKGELRVGFFEEEVAGTGNMWRSAGWMAVVVACQILGIDPRDYQFSFSVGGRIDGPSAGTYMTVGTLAALLGDKLRDDAAMTGTINPDGTVGPVGGIPHKVAGAAEHGAKLVLIPAGQRYDFDTNQQKMVDVVEVGRSKGVEVREVSTVFEAYKILTGKSLPQPPEATSAPQLPTRAFDRTRAKAQEWISRYQDARNKFNSLPKEITRYFEVKMKEADEKARSSQSALQQGLAAVAYQRAAQAAITAQMWLLAGEILERYATGGLDASIDYISSTQSTLGELDAVIELLRTEEPRSPGDYVALFDAYTSIGQAQGLVLLAKSELANLKKRAGSMDEGELLGSLTQLAVYYVLAKDYVQAARDSVEVGFGYGPAQKVDPERVEAMRSLLRHASDANITYFEATVVDEYAKKFGVHPDIMKQKFMNFDQGYLLTVASNYGVQALASHLKDPGQQVPLTLGNSISNYSRSAGLVSKYYSLGARLDKNGNVVSIQRERALADMLDLADRRAKETINLNGDDVPVIAVFYYEAARMKRQGSAEDQLVALEDYWEATALAQVQAYLAGKSPGGMR